MDLEKDTGGALLVDVWQACSTKVKVDCGIWINYLYNHSTILFFFLIF